MAVLKTVKTEHGIDVVDAYHKVNNVSIKDNGILYYEVFSYVDSKGEYPYFRTYRFKSAYDTDGGDVFAQAYNYLKLEEEFKDAVDEDEDEDEEEEEEEDDNNNNNDNDNDGNGNNNGDDGDGPANDDGDANDGGDGDGDG